MSEKLWCESCGEAEAEVRSTHASLCGDCYGAVISAVIREAIGDHVCGHPIFLDGKVVAVCVEPHGTEHEHGAYWK